AEVAERGPGHRQRLGDRPRGRARVEVGKELIADEVPADPAARAHQDKLAEPPGARPRPRARGAAPGDDGERPEEPDPYGHVPIVPHFLRTCLARASRVARTGGNTAGTAPSYCSGRTFRKGHPRCTRGIRCTRPSGPSPLASSVRSTWATPSWPRRSRSSPAGWPGRRVPGTRPGGRRRDARPPAPRPASSGSGLAPRPGGAEPSRGRREL